MRDAKALRLPKVLLLDEFQTKKNKEILLQIFLNLNDFTNSALTLTLQSYTYYEVMDAKTSSYENSIPLHKTINGITTHETSFID